MMTVELGLLLLIFTGIAFVALFLVLGWHKHHYGSHVRMPADFSEALAHVLKRGEWVIAVLWEPHNHSSPWRVRIITTDEVEDTLFPSRDEAFEFARAEHDSIQASDWWGSSG